MSQEYISFPAIIDELKSLCMKRVTGTLFVATKANRSVQIMIDEGEIVYIYFYNKRGQEAVELMTTIVAGKCRFQTTTAARRRDPSLHTQTIIQFLQNGKNGVANQSQDAPPKVPSKSFALTPQQKDILEQHLKKFIGPMAAVICEDHLDSASDMITAIDLLASEIPSAEQAEKFKGTVPKELQ